MPNIRHYAKFLVNNNINYVEKADDLYVICMWPTSPHRTVRVKLVQLLYLLLVLL